MPPVPMWRELGESHEILGVGTIFYQGDEPKVHLHGAFGKRDNVKVGCLREKAETFLVLEAVIVEIEGVNAVRELDPCLRACSVKTLVWSIMRTATKSPQLLKVCRGRKQLSLGK